ncbi:MAG: bifunctional riboflavin kinase/FAD synthetase [Oscillatoriales cyanobacterium RM2_1_1]|nr:bifunctional riboflavin kinase/FAD synthetase [Oscillatoriales cyanobacterium SM2_3_0]NJO45623.1 bifunctional riboflavin kinase/FAD synthetase [Oscillatoriales cyanobacterium RM2_1_1]
MWITSSLDTALIPTAVALGNFDGLHQGHRRVIHPVVQSFNPGPRSPLQLVGHLSSGYEFPVSVMDSYAPGNFASSSNRPYSTVVTFHPHPQEFFTGQPKKLLTPLDEKVECLQSLGVEQLVLLPFSQALAALSPEQFVEQVLVQGLQARYISVGFDFHFGKGRAGNAEGLRAIAHQHGIEVTVVPLYPSVQGERISSSMIRQALAEGDLGRVDELLGRPYQILGHVVQGQQLGRTLGFPTANLEVPPEKLLPKHGVYAVRVSLQGNNSSLIDYPGVMNIGCRPTVAGQNITVEVYLLDWSGDLYGQTLRVTLVEFLRSEQQFSSLENLKQQIQIDCLAARKVLSRESLISESE